MREIRTSGSEGGAGRKPRSYLYLGGVRTRSESGGFALLSMDSRTWTDFTEDSEIEKPTRRAHLGGASSRAGLQHARAAIKDAPCGCHKPLVQVSRLAFQVSPALVRVSRVLLRPVLALVQPVRPLLHDVRQHRAAWLHPRSNRSPTFSRTTANRLFCQIFSFPAPPSGS
jgi:hypothetical protein